MSVYELKRTTGGFHISEIGYGMVLQLAPQNKGVHDIETLAPKIVRALNTHDELVAALEEARAWVDEAALAGGSVPMRLLEEIDAALAKAKS